MTTLQELFKELDDWNSIVLKVGQEVWEEQQKSMISKDKLKKRSP